MGDWRRCSRTSFPAAAMRKILSGRHVRPEANCSISSSWSFPRLPQPAMATVIGFCMAMNSFANIFGKCDPYCTMTSVSNIKTKEYIASAFLWQIRRRFAIDGSAGWKCVAYREYNIKREKEWESKKFPNVLGREVVSGRICGRCGLILSIKTNRVSLYGNRNEKHSLSIFYYGTYISQIEMVKYWKIQCRMQRTEISWQFCNTAYWRYSDLEEKWNR